MEHLTSLVSSRGLLKSCDCRNENPISSSDHIDGDLLANHRPGGTIYVCTDAIENFITNFLPHISHSFILLTGDSDRAITDQYIESEQIQRLISSEYLINWYAQNNISHHGSVRYLPIGLDYHTMWERPGFWGIAKISPMAQEHLLLDIAARSPALGNRYPLAYCNWSIDNLHKGDRQECLDRIDREVCYFEQYVVPRASTWSRQAECAYVLSPEGFGVDCHRTWEALALGCIPIIKRNAISNQFENLPVLLVQDWHEITSQTLIDYYHHIKNKTFNFSTLFLKYWLNLVGESKGDILPLMGIEEFRKLLLRNGG